MKGTRISKEDTVWLPSMDGLHRIPHCTNCGLPGHVFRSCLSPVTSYGMIAMRYPSDTHQQALFSPSYPIRNPTEGLQFLLIQRKDSMSFVEFIRGKYHPHHDEYMGKLLQGMTQKEHELLRTLSFEQLWQHMWGGTSGVRSHKSEYHASEQRFSQMAHRIPELIERYPTTWTECEWGFPKGRRNPYETDMGCAMREFQEESGLHRGDYSVIHNTQSVSETFFGSNQVHYCHKYYFAICHPHVDVQMNLQNPHMTREISEIKWCSLEEAMIKIRPDHIEKQELLLKAGNIMKNFYPVSTLDSHRSMFRKA